MSHLPEDYEYDRFEELERRNREAAFTSDTVIELDEQEHKILLGNDRENFERDESDRHEKYLNDGFDYDMSEEEKEDIFNQDDDDDGDEDE